MAHVKTTALVKLQTVCGVIRMHVLFVKQRIICYRLMGMYNVCQLVQLDIMLMLMMEIDVEDVMLLVLIVLVIQIVLNVCQDCT